MNSPVRPVQLTDVLSTLRRHVVILIVLGVLGAGLGVGASYLLPASYRATASVEVRPTSPTPWVQTSAGDQSVLMATELQRARSRTIAAAAAEQLGDRYDVAVGDLRDRTTVENPTDSMVLTFTVKGSTAGKAAAGANAVAVAYLAERRGKTTRQIEAQRTRTTEWMSEVNKELRGAADGSGWQRFLSTQSDELGVSMAASGGVDTDGGSIVNRAQPPAAASTSGPVALGIAGLVLGLVLAVPIALTRKDEVDLTIASADRLPTRPGSLQLDGTHDATREETWDIAAFMLRIPAVLDEAAPFTIMLDSDDAGVGIPPGRELADALERRGRQARFVDAGGINEGKISRGWPTASKQSSWGGEIVVIDTSALSSDALKVALSTRADAVLLARSTTDELARLERLWNLLDSRGGATSPSRPCSRPPRTWWSSAADPPSPLRRRPATSPLVAGRRRVCRAGCPFTRFTW